MPVPAAAPRARGATVVSWRNHLRLGLVFFLSGAIALGHYALGGAAGRDEAAHHRIGVR